MTGSPAGYLPTPRGVAPLPTLGRRQATESLRGSLSDPSASAQPPARAVPHPVEIPRSSHSTPAHDYARVRRDSSRRASMLIVFSLAAARGAERSVQREFAPWCGTKLASRLHRHALFACRSASKVSCDDVQDMEVASANQARRLPRKVSIVATAPPVRVRHARRTLCILLAGFARALTTVNRHAEA